MGNNGGFLVNICGMLADAALQCLKRCYVRRGHTDMLSLAETATFTPENKQWKRKYCKHMTTILDTYSRQRTPVQKHSVLLTPPLPFKKTMPHLEQGRGTAPLGNVTGAWYRGPFSIAIQYKYSAKYSADTILAQYRYSTSTVQVQFNYNARTIQAHYKHNRNTV